MNEQTIYRSRLFLVLAGFALVAMIVVGFDQGSRIPVRGQQMMSLSNARAAGIALQKFAEDHDGEFPVCISELQPHYIPDSKLARSIVITAAPDRNRQLQTDWLYLGSGFTLENPPAILLASPQVIDSQNRKTRVYLTGDGAARIGIETEYQSTLAKTTRQMQELFARTQEASLAPR